MDKLIGYSVELFTHSCLQGLHYSIIYIYTRLKLKYEFNYIYIYINIINHITEHLLYKFVIFDRL
jgi:hypothetical protein